MIPDGKTINAPTPAGYELGYHLARFADAAPQIAERCFTCAFRQGTDANGSPLTTMDALKCVMEGEPFYCHETESRSDPQRLCAGYVILRSQTPGRNKMAWEFSDFT
jgi:hypothetical protein